jgi:GT2 family glycosyltransferase
VSAPDVRVGIVSWNTADWLRRCLTSLPVALGGLEAEVVVLDNDSSDGSAEVVAGFPGVELLRATENLGYARGMNLALAGTEARALLALNPDTEPEPRSLERLVALLDEEGQAGVVAPRLVNEDGTPQHSVYRFPSVRLAAVANLLPAAAQGGELGRRWCLETAGAPSGRQPVEWAIGAVHGIRRSALDGEDPYREHWFMYVEDLDLCWRLGRRGWTTVYEPDITVVHGGNAAGSQAWGQERTRRWLEATYDWSRREQGPRRTRAYAALNLAGSGVKAAGSAVAALAGGPRRAERRYWARELAAATPVHARAVLRPGRASVGSGPERGEVGR